MYGYVNQFSGHQLAAITITERVSSAVSVIASSIIIATFIWSKSFRKPINRLVFYATFGNILSNAGTLVSQSGIQNEPQSSLCQFQGFAIQWLVANRQISDEMEAKRSCAQVHAC